MYKPGGKTVMPDSNPGMIAMANASRDAQIANSENNKEAAIVQSNNGLMAMQTQAAVMELGIMENSKNTQFQTLAWLTERLDGLDTKLQIATKNAEIAMKEEGDRHDEKLGAQKLEARDLDLREKELSKPDTTSSDNVLV